MIASLNGFNYHIIDVDFQVLPYLMGKDNIHEALLDGTNVLEDEGNAIILVVDMI